MIALQSFTHFALQLAAKAGSIPMDDDNLYRLPRLLWLGYFTDISRTNTHVLASLATKGRAFIGWLET